MTTEPNSTTAETKVSNWVWVEPEEKRWQDMPPAEITIDSLVAFRNALVKECEKAPFKGTMAGTMLYRAAIDLDHAARLYKIAKESSFITMTYTVTEKPKKKKANKRKAKRHS